MRAVFLFFLFFGTLFSKPSQEEYLFRGKHFLASYSECDPQAIGDPQGVKEAMLEAVSKCGATILDQADYVFDETGITMVVLLSESHASIHTYPEHGACFVDLFTCGDNCSHEKFHQVLLQYLKAGQVNAKVLARHEGIEEQ